MNKERCVLAAYSDGGCIGRNPSPIGGTWSWCHVDTNELVLPDTYFECLVTIDSGYLFPEETWVGHIGRRIQGLTVSNNAAEYLALALCLRALPSGWSGPVYTDSFVTLQRFRDDARHNGIPHHWRHEKNNILSRLGKLEFVLLDGHPTRKELVAGRGKRGGPVSDFNVECDRLCSELAKDWKGKLAIEKRDGCTR